MFILFSKYKFSNLAFNLSRTSYRQRNDIGLIPRSFNSETPRQRDTFKHIEAGSCSRSPFALSPPFHIYLGLLHYGATRRFLFLFFSFPFYRSVSPGLSAYSATNAASAIWNEHADCFCAPGEFTSGDDNSLRKHNRMAFIIISMGAGRTSLLLDSTSLNNKGNIPTLFHLKRIDCF